MNDFDDLIKLLGLKFKDISLLELAFVHRSFLNESKGKHEFSNERLEFLGDAILSFIVSNKIYHEFPNLPEGDLTNYRSALVCAKTLAIVSQKLGLGKYLKMSKGEKESGGKDNPSLLANTVEALIGSIYLDQGLEVVKKFIDKYILSELSDIIENKSFKDYKSLFQELVQNKIKLSPIYQVTDSWGPDHAKNFKIGVIVEGKLIAEGVGKSKQEGEQAAAKAGIENWNKMR